MWQYLWILSKKYYDYFILTILAIVFFIASLFLYTRPSVLELSPLNVLSCGNSRLFGSVVERGTVSTIAGVEIKCGGGDPVEIKEQTVPAYLILNQPDESINYFFIRQLVFYNQFSAVENLSDLTLNQVHPRSTTVVNKNLVPIGFPGFIVLVSALVKILSIFLGQNLFNVLVIIITPLIGALTPFFAYYLWRRFWDKTIALTAASLLFILPPWWYNSSRPFQHNLLFLFFVIVSICFYLAAGKKDKRGWLKVFLSSLFWGLALYVRPSEVIWLSALAAVGLFQARKKWPKKYYGLIAGSLLLVAGMFFATQQAFYGHIFGSGYVRPQASGAAGTVFSGPQGINFWQALILPFGFHPLNILKIFAKYFFGLFRIWFLLVFGGGYFLLLDYWQARRQQKIIDKKYFLNFKYLAVWSGLSLFLLIYYGSWEFFDNLVKVPSIGTSYVRYFLPIYVFSLPLAACFLVKLWRVSNKKIAKVLTVILTFLIIGSSLTAVYFQLDGLNQVKENVKQYQGWQEKVYQLTEPEAIVVTRYADKYIFPSRKVIPGWSEESQIQAIINLVKAGYPVYLYDLKLDQAVEDDLQQKLSSGGLAIKETISSWDNLELRKIGSR